MTATGNWLQYGLAAIRYCLAFVFVTYSAAKFSGAQFITEGPILDTPISQMSGIELTWSYFGRSSLYSNFIAASQLIGGILLLSQRTVRLALMILLPMMGNIVLVNFAYDISIGTKVFSLALLGLLLALVSSDCRAWFSFMFERPVTSPPTANSTWKWKVPLALLLIVTIFAAVASITEKLLPTCEIAGNWTVVEIDGIEEADAFSKLYLMHGRRMGVEKDRSCFFGQQQTDGNSELEFEVTIWPTPDELIWRDRLLPDTNPDGLSYRERQRREQREWSFDGEYQRLSDNRLRLQGTLNDRSVTIQLIKD